MAKNLETALADYRKANQAEKRMNSYSHWVGAQVRGEGGSFMDAHNATGQIQGEQRARMEARNIDARAATPGYTPQEAFDAKLRLAEQKNELAALQATHAKDVNGDEATKINDLMNHGAKLVGDAGTLLAKYMETTTDAQRTRIEALTERLRIASGDRKGATGAGLPGEVGTARDVDLDPSGPEVAQAKLLVTKLREGASLVDAQDSRELIKTPGFLNSIAEATASGDAGTSLRLIKAVGIELGIDLHEIGKGTANAEYVDTGSQMVNALDQGEVERFVGLTGRYWQENEQNVRSNEEEAETHEEFKREATRSFGVNAGEEIAAMYKKGYELLDYDRAQTLVRKGQDAGPDGPTNAYLEGLGDQEFQMATPGRAGISSAWDLKQRIMNSPKFQAEVSDGDPEAHFQARMREIGVLAKSRAKAKMGAIQQPAPTPEAAAPAPEVSAATVAPPEARSAIAWDDNLVNEQERARRRKQRTAGGGISMTPLPDGIVS